MPSAVRAPDRFGTAPRAKIIIKVAQSFVESAKPNCRLVLRKNDQALTNENQVDPQVVGMHAAMLPEIIIPKRDSFF